MFRLDQKTAVITGAGSGIGKAVALLFARQGAVTHLLDLNEKALQEVAQQIRDAGGQGGRAARRCYRPRCDPFPVR